VAAIAAGWSAARMQAARPLEAVRGGNGRTHLRVRTVPFMSTEVTAPTTPPNQTNGRLFGHLDGFGDYSCSATVLDTFNGRVILTAGHCVFEPRLGEFATDLAFVPAYTDGGGPYGIWEWQSAVTTRQWAVRANTNFDFAAIKLRKSAGTPIETAIGGGRRMKTNVVRRQGYWAFGYPANLGEGERMWSCLSEYAGKDPRPFAIGKAPTAIGCDMTAGASGGGWINSAGNLVSVTSFGYQGKPNIIFGPYLTVQARRLVSRVAH
jgi:V8-like Glu-specific endopeptidase